MTHSVMPRRRRPSADAPSALLQLTRGLHATYSKCTRPMRAASPIKPARDDAAGSATHRILTKKTRPSGNNGLDNEEQNLIVRARDVFGGREATPMQPEFVVLDMLGQGTFGQVFRCQNVDTKEIVAIKVIRNHPSYYKQAIVEVQITRLLNASYREDEAPHFVRLRDTFEFRNHLCIVFELLSINLYELIAENNFNGFSLEITRGFQQQILHALVRMDEIGVIHCDLKPENILLVGKDRFLSDVMYHNDPQMARIVASCSTPGGSGKPMTSSRLASGETPYIKVVDFGSACMENETVYSYIQSRFYRSPEVLLGIPYTGSIDLWSLGCIAVEMFLGLPLFPGVSEHDQLRLIEETLGKLPQELLRQGRNVLKFYNVQADNHFVLKTPEEFARDANAEVQISKKYFKYTKLEDMIHAYPHAKHASESQIRRERKRREAFLHFVRGLLCVDPKKRCCARITMQHPFITGAQFVQEEVEFAQVLGMSPAFSPSGNHQPVLPLPKMPSVILPQRYDFQTQPPANVWSSPARSDFGELSTTPSYNESIWGTMGMAPYAPGSLQHAEQLSPAANYYVGDSRGNTSQKVMPSSQGESNRVYPYDPYTGTESHHHGYSEQAHAYSPRPAGYAPSHCRTTRTLSLASSIDGFPIVPVSPYDNGPQGFDSPYYVQPPQHMHVVASAFEWPAEDAVYQAQTAPVRRGTWGHELQESYQQETIPRHHQYMPEQANPPPRRGKRQHTNSWDSGDTRELRRHEPSHGHSSYYGHSRTQYHTPQQLQRSYTVGNSGPSRIQSTPRKMDHKTKGSTARHRKSPKAGVAPSSGSRSQHHHHHQYHQHNQQQQRSYSRRHDLPTPRDVSEYVAVIPPHHHHHEYPPPKRDESTGVCSVEEKFSSAMSLGISSSALPLPI